MSNAMVDYWVGFASGDVNAFKPAVEWQPFTSANQNKLELNTNPRMTTWDTGKCNFWDGLGYRF